MLRAGRSSLAIPSLQNEAFCQAMKPRAVVPAARYKFEEGAHGLRRPVRLHPDADCAERGLQYDRSAKFGSRRAGERLNALRLDGYFNDPDRLLHESAIIQGHFRYPLYGRHSLGHAAEGGVFSFKRVLRGHTHKELNPVQPGLIRDGYCRYNAAIENCIVYFHGDRSAHSRAPSVAGRRRGLKQRVAALNDPSRDGAMKRAAVVVTRPRECKEA